MRIVSVLALVSSVMLGGCLGDSRSETGGPQDFTISKSDDRFDESTETALLADGCRISNTNPSGSNAGYGLGLFLDPNVYKDKVSGKVNSCSFSITNAYVVIPGAALAYTFGRIESVTFNVDGAVISLKMTGRPDYFKSLGGGSIRHDFAVGTLSEESMRKLIGAKSIALNINGTHQSRTLNDADIDPAWRDKLRRFKAEAMEKASN
jgi:hypothetical protein